jgi:mRNA interferase MazF
MRNGGYPLRGEIWWVSFGPSVGTEIQKTRPAIIVSNNPANEFWEQVQVVPLTSNMTRVFSSQAVVSVSGEKSKAVTDQITTVSKLRVSKKIGTITADELADVERALKLQLGLLR